MLTYSTAFNIEVTDKSLKLTYQVVHKRNDMLIQKIVQELEAIPEDKLAELYDLIHYFRLDLEKKKPQEPRKPGLIKGDIDDAFFDPLPEEELRLWE